MFFIKLYLIQSFIATCKYDDPPFTGLNEGASVGIALGSVVGVGAGAVGVVLLVKHLSTRKTNAEPGADTTDVEKVQPDPNEPDQPMNDELNANGPPNSHFQMAVKD